MSWIENLVEKLILFLLFGLDLNGVSDLKPFKTIHSMTQRIKNLPAVEETEVAFLGGEDSLEKGMATHSGILAWEIPWTEEPGETVHGVAESLTRLTH